MSAVDNTRPPYVVFEYRAVEDRDASIKAGHHVSKEVAYVTVTRPGSRDSFEAEALSWLASMKDKARQGIVPDSWHVGFTQAFEAWKKGEEIPANGTPIKGWPVLGVAAQKDLIKIGILTVEDLAGANDSAIAMIGTGGVSYKTKARAWLDEAQTKGISVERINALETKLGEAISLVEKLMEENKALKAQTPAVATKAG